MTAPDLGGLRARIEALAGTPAGEALSDDASDAVEELLDHLESGELRAASQGADGTWSAVAWVKRGILLAFRHGVIVPTAGTEGGGADG